MSLPNVSIGIPFDGQIIANGELHRYSCDEKKNKPDEWFVGFHGFSRRGTPTSMSFVALGALEKSIISVAGRKMILYLSKRSEN